jgi:predicted phosphodiesterase
MAVYGVLGDIHGNREALEATLARIDTIGVDRMLCVGDVIGYNADPDECVRILQSRDVLCIAGNHDLIGTGQLGFERCSNKAMHSLKRTRRTLGESESLYVRQLPSHFVLEEKVLLTHGGVRDVQQYMTRPKHFLQNAKLLRQDFPGIRICFYGHTHEQRVVEIDGEAVCEIKPSACVALRGDVLYFVNPGSVDASRKRTTKRAEFAIFDSDALTLRFEDVAYDDAVTEEKAARSGYRIDRWRDRLYDVQRRIVGPRHVESGAP